MEVGTEFQSRIADENEKKEHLSISNDTVSFKIYDKRDDFDSDIVIFPFLDGDIPRSLS